MVPQTLQKDIPSFRSPNSRSVTLILKITVSVPSNTANTILFIKLHEGIYSHRRLRFSVSNAIDLILIYIIYYDLSLQSILDLIYNHST